MASSQIGGALPADLPPAAGSKSVGKTDKAIARSTANRLLSAVKTTNDPQLKATFSQALSEFHTYLAQDSKEDKKGQGPKVSSKAVPKSKKK